MSEDKIFKCSECDYKCKKKDHLKLHLWCVHNIGEGEIFKCSVCNYESKINGNLKRHLWCVHNIGEGKIFKCNHCNFEGKTNENLKRHLWEVHNIGKGKIFKCSECNYECKSNGNLKRHLWEVHNIGKNKIFKCSECNYECKSNSVLKKHLWQVHNIGEGKIFKCSECNYECKLNNCLKTHLWLVHNIGEGEIFKCSECDYECKSKRNLKIHLWCVHNMGEGKIFKCSECECDYECKTNSHMKRHLSNVHDIGNLECPICLKMVFNLLPEYINPKITTRTEIIKTSCRNCYKKITGYSSRIEKQMVEYLKKNNNIQPYIMSKDKIIKGSDCNTKRRPDLIIGSNNELIIIVDCDEKQHIGYNPSCEMGRMDEILDELKNTRTIIIRWNPDICKNNGKKLKKNREERLIELENLIIQLINKKDWDNQYTMIYYMYYNQDNENITNRHSYELLY